jgi:hypothetical protein
VHSYQNNCTVPQVSTDEVDEGFPGLEGVGILAGTQTSINNPAGTIVPVNISPQGITKCNSPVIYDATSNCFIVLECGLYEITYYIQGTFLLECPVGVPFGVFIDDILISQSRTRASTVVGLNNGGSFNISKSFCVFFSHNGYKKESCPLSLTPTRGLNCVQVRAITNGNDEVADCIDTIVATSILSRTDGTFVLSSAGTLNPDNAFEITFKQIGNACM